MLTEETVAFIRQCLEEDKAQGTRKQRHTAKRIYDRLVAEHGFVGGESTVREKVRELKGAMPQAFVPLAFSPGEAMQVDWGEAVVYINGVKQTVNLFCARLCYSCAPVVFAYRRQNEESFLDAFVNTFKLFGGVAEKVIFDNGKVAVKDGFGAHAQKQAGYTALSAHYGFDALFCNPAEGHEKGLVEGLVGWARRNILVPVPKVFDLSELNAMLANRCQAYGNHHIQGKSTSVGEMLSEEQPSLRPLPIYSFETARCASVRVNAFSTVRFNTNDYSVPVKYVGRWEDVDFENGIISISHTLARVNGEYKLSTPKTKSSERMVKVPIELIAMLKEHKRWQTERRLFLGSRWIDREAVFTGDFGEYHNRTYLNTSFKRLIKKRGLPDVHVHDLRHVNASLLINAGVPVKVISEHLGHRNTQTTEDIYAHLFAASKAKASEAISIALSK